MTYIFKSGKRILATVAIAGMIVGCGADDDSETSTATAGLKESTNPGAAIGEINAALASVGTLTVESGLLLSGIANDYCTVSGDPIQDGEDLSGNDIEAAAHGFCQSTFNSQSQDTPRGALYMAGGLACELGAAEGVSDLAVGESLEVDLTIDFGTDCWGTEAEANAFKADTFSEDPSQTTLSLSGLVAERLAADHAYQYKFTIVVPDMLNVIVQLRSGDGIRAAQFKETGENGVSSWAIQMDASDLDDVSVYYERADTTYEGHSRVLVKGKMNETGTFSAIDNISGFVARGNDESNALYTFNGNLTAGFLGASYSHPNGGEKDNDDAGFCYLPTNDDADCDGLEPILSSIAQSQAIAADLSDSVATLAAFEGLISFDSIDVTDHDVTD